MVQKTNLLGNKSYWISLFKRFFCFDHGSGQDGIESMIVQLLIFSTSDRLLSDVLLLSKVRDFTVFCVFLGGRVRPCEAV